MSEYIVEESPTTYETDILGVKHSVTSYRRREEIVRCRDCKWCWWGDLDLCACARNPLHHMAVEPDGFCAWGERWDDDSDR